MARNVGACMYCTHTDEINTARMRVGSANTHTHNRIQHAHEPSAHAENVPRPTFKVFRIDDGIALDI